MASTVILRSLLLSSNFCGAYRVSDINYSWFSIRCTAEMFSLHFKSEVATGYVLSRFLHRSQVRNSFEAFCCHIEVCRPGSSVGIATGYGLYGPRIESQWGARFFAPVQTGSGAHPASCTMGTGSFPGVKSGRGVTLTHHPLLVPWSWKGRAIPLLPIWVVRPVQSLSVCTRVHFNFT